MAFVAQPDTWIANWSEDGVDISVPLATFTELTAAEADGTTGDIRKLLFAICYELFESWNGKATADRPSNMTISKSTLVDNPNATLTHTFSFKFVCEIGAQEVKDES